VPNSNIKSFILFEPNELVNDIIYWIGFSTIFKIIIYLNIVAE